MGGEQLSLSQLTVWCCAAEKQLVVTYGTTNGKTVHY